MDPSVTRPASVNEAIEDGRILYVSGRFYEAHARWEQAWRGVDGIERSLLQGLILAAGAYQKMAERKQPSGMVTLLERSLARLGSIPDGYAGLSLERFRRGLRTSLAEARVWHGGGPLPSGPARLGRVVSRTWASPEPEDRVA